MVRFYEGYDRRLDDYALRCLDEVQENINGYMKSLILDNTQESWIYHSPNIMFAKKSLLHEETEYLRTSVTIDDDGNMSKTETVNTESSSVSPRKTIERKRLYEWMIAMFDVTVPNRNFGC